MDNSFMDIPLLNKSGFLQTKEVEFRYIWTINNFYPRSEKTGDYLTSPTFSFGANDQCYCQCHSTKWYLALYPNGNEEENKDYLSLFIVFSHSIKSEAEARVNFSIRNSYQEESNSIGCLKFHQFTKQNKILNFPQFIDMKPLLVNGLHYLPNNKLTIVCKIAMKADHINPLDSTNATQLIKPECRLLYDLQLIFKKQKFTDVTLFVAGKEFQAHKAILAARSPVFEAMFQHELQEKKHNRIEIVDVEPEVVLEMLRFMYTGKVENLENIAVDLLRAADKYALERLKAMCEEILCNVAVDNAVKVLLVADLHKANQLKAHTIDFIARHSKDVMETPDWRSMVHTHPGLLEELFRVVTQNINHG